MDYIYHWLFHNQLTVAITIAAAFFLVLPALLRWATRGVEMSFAPIICDDCLLVLRKELPAYIWEVVHPFICREVEATPAGVDTLTTQKEAATTGSSSSSAQEPHLSGGTDIGPEGEGSPSGLGYCPDCGERLVSFTVTGQCYDCWRDLQEERRAEEP